MGGGRVNHPCLNGVVTQNSRSQFQFPDWRHDADAYVAAVVIICAEPAGGDALHLLDGVEDVKIQPLVAHGAFISLAIGVLPGLAGLDMLQRNALLFCQIQQSRPDKIRPVVHPYIVCVVPNEITRRC